mgnify:CR=1 FL=1
MNDLGQFPDFALVNIIVGYRTLNINKQLAKECMSELGRRRFIGDDFNFEDEIEAKIKKFPKPDPPIYPVNSMIRNQLENFLGQYLKK